LFATSALGLAGETNTAIRPAKLGREKIEVTGVKKLLPGCDQYLSRRPADGGRHETVCRSWAFGRHQPARISFGQGRGCGHRFESVRFETKPWHAEEEDVIGFLKAVTDTNICRYSSTASAVRTEPG